MKEQHKKLRLAIITLLLTIGLAAQLFAGNSISGVARCRVPHIISITEEQNVIIEKSTQNTDAVQTAENNDSLNKEADSGSTIQQNEVVLEETEEVELMNTVCAR